MAGTFNLGPYQIWFANGIISPIDLVNPSVSVYIAAPSVSNDPPSKLLWKTIDSNGPFLRVANGQETRPPILNGNYQLQEIVDPTSYTDSMTITDISSSKFSLTFSGKLEKLTGNGYYYDFSFNYVDKPDDSTSQYALQFAVNVTTLEGSSPVNRLFVSYWCEEDENFYGFGESFTYFNLKGKNVPILVSEQGVGRGIEPLTTTMNTMVAEGVGGHWYTTYAPKSVYLTNYNRSVLVEESKVMFVDLTKAASSEVTLYAWSTSLAGRLFLGSSWMDLIQLVTGVTGRQAGRLPPWSQRGAVVGLEGGTEEVTNIVDEMKSSGVSIAGVWLQDWVGLRHSWDGDRLIWNWELNNDWYPGWKDMVQNWADDGTRVLTYISPFFSNPANFTNSSEIRNNFFEQGIANNYFVRTAEGLPYKMYSLSIEFCMLDPTNPEAREWMKNIIVQQMVVEANSSGWMCDFGEYLPFDAHLFSGEPASSYHNKYPQEWGALNIEAITSAHLTQGTRDPDEIVFFMRSAWMKSPAAVPLFWLGDQLVSWDEFDGLQSAITGALSSGLTGHALTHSDIGGYSVVTDPLMPYYRTPELLKRWSEFAAFGSALYRTHIGSSTSPLNAQVYDSEDSMEHFGRFAAIFGNLSSYREKLFVDASKFGYPMIRPMVLHYAHDDHLWGLANSENPQQQYLFGEEFIIAPVVTEGAEYVSAYLPAHSGPWIHLWSGKELDPGTNGLEVTVPAGIGYPFVAYQYQSKCGQELQAFVTSRGYNSEYVWSDSSTKKNDPVVNGFTEFFGIMIPLMIIGLLIFFWFGGSIYSSEEENENGEQRSFYQQCRDFFVFGDMAYTTSERRSSAASHGPRTRSDQKYALLVNPGKVVSPIHDHNSDIEACPGGESDTPTTNLHEYSNPQQRRPRSPQPAAIHDEIQELNDSDRVRSENIDSSIDVTETESADIAVIPAAEASTAPESIRVPEQPMRRPEEKKSLSVSSGGKKKKGPRNSSAGNRIA